MTKIESVNLMSTREKREYMLKYKCDEEILVASSAPSLPIVVTIKYLPYEVDSSGTISKHTLENEVIVKDSLGTTLYHGRIVKGGHPYEAESEGKYDYDAELLIGLFSDPQCSVNADNLEELLTTLFPQLVSVDGDSDDHDCECCGSFTNSTVELKHKELPSVSVTYDYDGHFGYGYTPNLTDLFSFALTGSANTEHYD